MLYKLSKIFHSWARDWVILVLLGLLAVYIAITLPLLVSAPGGNIESLDSQFFYTPEEAFTTIALYVDAGSFWIWMYLTWDIATPVLYSLMFSLIISWLFQRGFSPGSKVQILNVMPFVAGFFDVFENLSIVILLSTYPNQPPVIPWISTFCTMGKISFLTLSTFLILLGLVIAALNRFRKP